MTKEQLASLLSEDHASERQRSGKPTFVTNPGGFSHPLDAAPDLLGGDAKYDFDDITSGRFVFVMIA